MLIRDFLSVSVPLWLIAFIHITLSERRQLMSQNKNKDSQDLKEELIISLIQGLDSIVELLIEKGVITREEYLEKVNKLKKQRNIFDR